MGKYQVSECIGRGGMAEVFLARQAGMGGFEKLVALKRIYPHLIHDENFVTMFVREARIAASLAHPKIVQIFDIESDEQGPFIVMEYLAGESISQILKLLSDRDEKIPPRVVCRIGSDVATGLHVAHTASDGIGKIRPVVHGDVTPSNILVTYGGAVKVLDFGVAKAVSQHVTTDRGVLKGKTPYLTPEQLRGDPVDPRADIFQLGIVIHEMLTGRRLFKGDSANAVFQSINEAEIPAPRSLNTNSTKALDAVVLKALSRDPDDRFQTADQLAKELETVAHDFGEPVTERSLSEWMRKTFPKEEQDKLRRKTAALEQKTDEVYERLPLPPITDELATHSSLTVRARPPDPKKDVQIPWIRLVMGTVAVAVGVVIFLLRNGQDNEASELAPPANEPPAELSSPNSITPTPAASPTYKVEFAVMPADAVIEVDGKEVATGKYSVNIASTPHEVRLSAEGYESQSFVISRNRPPPKLVHLQPLSATDTADTKAEKTQNQPRPQKSPPTTETRPYGSDNLDPWKGQ